MSEFEAIEKAKHFNYLVGMRTMFPKTYDLNYQEYEVKNIITARISDGFGVYIELEGVHGGFNSNDSRLSLPLDYFKQNWVVLRMIGLIVREVAAQHQVVVTIPKNEISGHPHFIFSGGGLGGGSPLPLDLSRTEENDTHYERIYNLDYIGREILEFPDGTLKAFVVHDGIKYQSNVFKTKRQETVLSR